MAYNRGNLKGLRLDCFREGARKKARRGVPASLPNRISHYPARIRVISGLIWSDNSDSCSNMSAVVQMRFLRLIAWSEVNCGSRDMGCNG